MSEPRDIGAPPIENPTASATQLSILLSAATSAIDEEFKRSERLDAKARNLITVTATIFAAVQAGVIALLNGILAASATEPRSGFAVWLAGLGALAACATVAAVAASYPAWKLRGDKSISLRTIEAYVDHARRGNPAVGVHLVKGYVEVAKLRRANNDSRADAVDRASLACVAAIGIVGIELVLAFVAAAVK